jgi:hypothetical protein
MRIHHLNLLTLICSINCEYFVWKKYSNVSHCVSERLQEIIIYKDTFLQKYFKNTTNCAPVACERFNDEVSSQYYSQECLDLVPIIDNNKFGSYVQISSYETSDCNGYYSTSNIYKHNKCIGGEVSSMKYSCSKGQVLFSHYSTSDCSGIAYKNSSMPANVCNAGQIIKCEISNNSIRRILLFQKLMIIALMFLLC